MLNFAGAMNKLSVSGRLLTLSPAFDCNFRVTVEGPSGKCLCGHLPIGVDGRIRYSPTTEIFGEWSSAGVNVPFDFIHEPRPRLGAALQVSAVLCPAWSANQCRLTLRDPEITELHFQLDVKGNGECKPRQFDAVRLEQQCRAHVSGSGQLSDWSLVPHGQLRTPTYKETGSNRGAQASRRLKDSSPSQDSDDDSSDDDGADSAPPSEFVGVPCIDPAANVSNSENRIMFVGVVASCQWCPEGPVLVAPSTLAIFSLISSGPGSGRMPEKEWPKATWNRAIATRLPREVSKLLDETLLESLNNILRHVLAIGPGILISAWTAKLIFVQSTIPGYFSYFFTMVYSPAAWVLNNVWHQTADDWRLSLGLAAMAFWTIPVSVVGMKYGLHRPMSVARAMSLVNNLLLLYYFVLFAAVVFIVMFVFSDEPESEAYFSVSAAFRRKLRPGKLSKEGEGCFKWGSLAESVRQRIISPAAETESFAVFFITCCAATDAFIMVIVKARRGGPFCEQVKSMLQLARRACKTASADKKNISLNVPAAEAACAGKPLPTVQAVSQHADYAVEMAPSKYTLDINGKDPLELLSDDTWEALCCEEITIVPALNTETDVDLISGKLGPLRAHTPLKVKLWAALQYASKHECQIELPHWLEASELETMCKEERAEPLKFGNVPRHYIEIAEALLAIPRAWGSESAREKSLLMLTKLIQIRRAKILEGIQAFDATLSTEFKVTGMSAAEITCFRTRSLAFLDTMLELLNYRLDETEKGGVAEAPIEEADDEDTLYAIEEQVTRDWLLLMKESSDEGQP
ncbi:PSF2 [Symbiodinium sp. CCMP2456]|nr:PSF2 [Symbiodinium sp. CCMP2456]